MNDLGEPLQKGKYEDCHEKFISHARTIGIDVSALLNASTEAQVNEKNQNNKERKNEGKGKNQRESNKTLLVILLLCFSFLVVFLSSPFPGCSSFKSTSYISAFIKWRTQRSNHSCKWPCIKRPILTTRQKHQSRLIKNKKKNRVKGRDEKKTNRYLKGAITKDQFLQHAKNINQGKEKGKKKEKHDRKNRGRKKGTEKKRRKKD